MCSFRENFNNLISEKDKELETLRNEVRTLSTDSSATKSISIHSCCCIFAIAGVVGFGLRTLLCQIAVLRGENAVAKTMQAAVASLEQDKVKLQNRVHSLEQKLEGRQTDDQEENSSGEPAC